MAYQYEASDQIPGIRFLPSMVAEKNASKNMLGRTEGKTVYPLPVERGYNNIHLREIDMVCLYI